MCACVHLCEYISVQAFMCLCVYIYIIENVYMYVHICDMLYVLMYVCGVCFYLCMPFTCVHVCECLCTHTYTRIHIPGGQRAASVLVGLAQLSNYPYLLCVLCVLHHAVSTLATV